MRYYTLTVTLRVEEFGFRLSFSGEAQMSIASLATHFTYLLRSMSHLTTETIDLGASPGGREQDNANRLRSKEILRDQ